MKKKLNLGLVQMKVTKSKEANLKKAEALILKAVNDGANMVILPEMFICPYDNAAFIEYAEELDGPSIERMRAIAKYHGIYIFSGSIPEKLGDKIYNTCAAIEPQGEIIGIHRKMHMFDINVPGQVFFKESDTLSAGNRISIAETEYGRVGMAVCFDIRFPELHRLMAMEGVFLIAVPAAFNMVTGPAHWDLIFRARAVDNQVYVAVASPARDKCSGYVAYGHSMIVNPWGKVLTDAGTDENVVVAELTPHEFENNKNRLPLLTGRRTDVYDLKRLDV